MFNVNKFWHMGNKNWNLYFIFNKIINSGLLKYQTTNPTRDNERVQKYDLESLS